MCFRLEVWNGRIRRYNVCAEYFICHLYVIDIFILIYVCVLDATILTSSPCMRWSTVELGHFFLPVQLVVARCCKMHVIFLLCRSLRPRADIYQVWHVHMPHLIYVSMTLWISVHAGRAQSQTGCIGTNGPKQSMSVTCACLL